MLTYTFTPQLYLGSETITGFKLEAQPETGEIYVVTIIEDSGEVIITINPINNNNNEINKLTSPINIAISAKFIKENPDGTKSEKVVDTEYISIIPVA
jgi:hypothetical protein